MQILDRIFKLQLSFSSVKTSEMVERHRLVTIEFASWIETHAAEVLSSKNLCVKGSTSTGRYAHVPWVRIYDQSKSPTAQNGFYLVYLFSFDGERLYLSLNQGTTTGGTDMRPKSDSDLRVRVDTIRKLLAESSHQLSSRLKVESIDLGDPNGLQPNEVSGLARQYEKGHVYGIEYKKGLIPSEKVIAEDLIHLCDAQSFIYSSCEDHHSTQEFEDFLQGKKAIEELSYGHVTNSDKKVKTDLDSLSRFKGPSEANTSKGAAGKGNAGALVYEQPLEKDYFGMSDNELFTEAQKGDGQKALDELRIRSVKSKQKGRKDLAGKYLKKLEEGDYREKNEIISRRRTMTNPPEDQTSSSESLSNDTVPPGPPPVPSETDEEESAKSFSVAKAIGLVIADRVENELSSSSSGKSLILVENFLPEEVYFAVQILKNISRIKVKVTDPISRDFGEGTLSAEELFFRENDTLTKIRNDLEGNDSVVFVMSPQGDRAGVANMLKLNDDNLLSGESGSDIHSRLLIKCCWEAGRGGRKSENFYEQTEKILSGLLNKHWDRIPLRPCAEFIVLAARHLVGVEFPSPNYIREKLLKQLPSLSMFQDTVGVEDSEIITRIDRNYLRSRLLRYNGSDEDGEKLAARARTTEFLDADDQPLSEDEQENLRNLCAGFFEDYPHNRRHYYKQIAWEYIQQIFRSPGALKLGEKVKEEIVEADSSRLDEFEVLDVELWLNKNDSEAARKFLQAKPDEEQSDAPLLIELITQSTRSRVENLARKALKVENFLPWLLEEMHQVSLGDDLEGKELVVRLEPVRLKDGESDFTRRLFTFLYGATLSEICRETESSYRIKLDLADAFKPSPRTALDFQTISDFINAEEGGTDPDPWPDLIFLLSVRQEGSNKELLRYQKKWSPEGQGMLAAFFLIACNGEARASLAWSYQAGIDDWIANLIRGNLDCSAHAVVTEMDDSGLVGKAWAEARSKFLENISNNGLSISDCSKFFNFWQGEGVLETALKEEFLLTGGVRQEFNRFMSFDTVKTRTGLTLLATHPFRVRWIGRYLQEMKARLLDALSVDGLTLSEPSGGFYFRRLENLNPYQQPPYFVYRDQEGSCVYHSAAEYGWSENYFPVNPQAQSKKEETDIKCIEAIAKECRTFTQHHPHKLTGTDILIVLNAYSDFPEKFLRKFYGNRIDAEDPRVRLHILAPAEVLSTLPILKQEDPSFFEHREEFQLMPFVDINAHHWSNEAAELPETLKKLKIDIAIIPSIFVDALKTEPRVHGGQDEHSAGGVYNPLTTRPYRLQFLDREANVQIAWLPDSDDTALFSWSSLNVQLEKNQPLQAGRADTEYFQLRMELEKSDKLMTLLHDISLWVITLDKYLARNNIEKLTCSPEVISFRDNIGKNGNFNLITSANMGKAFVIPRLIGKLRTLNSQYFDNGLDDEGIQVIATRLFDESGKLAPGVMLRSLGGGWTLNELLGLVCTKRHLSMDSVPQGCILSAWIPLDHHTDWFGGAGNKRADLLWVTVYRGSDRGVKLMSTVVESKFGWQSGLGHAGAKQVQQTCAIIDKAFDPTARSKDGRFWRESLVRAIESAGVIKEEDFVYTSDGSSFGGTVKDEILNGSYEIAERDPRVVWHDPSIQTNEDTNYSGISSERLGQNTIISLLTEANLQSEPLPPEPEPEPEPEPLPPELEPEPEPEPLPPELEPEPEPESLPPELEPEPEPESSLADKSFYINRTGMNGQQELFPLSKIQSLLDEDSITPDTFAWWEGLSDWKKVSDIPGIRLDGVSPISLPPLPGEATKELELEEFGSMTDEEKKNLLQEVLNHLQFVDPRIVAPNNLSENIIEGPACIRFLLKREIGVVDINLVKNQLPQLKTALNLPGDQKLNVVNNRGVWLEVPKEDSKRTYVTCDRLWELYTRTDLDNSIDFHIPIGIDQYGDVVTIKFSGEGAPHLLIGGATEMGKSVAINTIIKGCMRFYSQDELRIHLVDPKMVELVDYANVPHVGGSYFTESVDALNLFEGTLEEITHRNTTFTSKGPPTPRDIGTFNVNYPQEKFPRWLIIIDEYADLMEGSDRETKNEMERCIKRICRIGRSAGVHLILSTQKVSAAVVPTEIRDNFQARLSLKVADANASRIILDSSGAETLMPRGDAIFKDGSGVKKRTQIAKAEDY